MGWAILLVEPYRPVGELLDRCLESLAVIYLCRLDYSNGRPGWSSECLLPARESIQTTEP